MSKTFHTRIKKTWMLLELRQQVHWNQGQMFLHKACKYFDFLTLYIDILTCIIITKENVSHKFFV